MDRDEAREAAYNWIEKTFIDKIAYDIEENNDEYNLAKEIGFNEYQVDLDTCWLENVGFADELNNMLYDDIKISFEKKSRNSGRVSFKLKEFRHEDMEIILELYENILQRHYLEKMLMLLRGGTAWVRGLINDGWFIYDKERRDFCFFTPGFNVYDRKIENEIGSFMIEVSLTGFENIGGDVHVIRKVKEKYPDEPEILKWIIEQIIKGKKPNASAS